MRILMTKSPRMKVWSAVSWKDIAPGAQTERRGGAGPVRGLLGGKDLTGRFRFSGQDQVVSEHAVLNNHQSEPSTSPPASGHQAGEDSRMSRRCLQNSGPEPSAKHGIGPAGVEAIDFAGRWCN